MSNLSAASQCQIKAFQADISCLASLKRMLQAIQQDSNLQLRGVFTGAAVLADSVFNKIDRKKFERVMSPKVQGTWNLHKLTEGMPLDYFVMHSSVASVLGNMGQGNYSAANAFMDGLAYYRRYRGLAAQTINWGPLDTGLMNGHDAFKRRIQTLGFSIATEQEIHEMLKVALLLNWVQTIPVKIDFDLYCQKLDNTELPVLKFRLQKLTSSSEENQTRSTSVTELDGGMLKDMEAGPERLLACEQYVTELTRRVLSEDHAHISRDANLTALGVDSVNGMMMINVIHRDTSFKIAAVDVLADATIASLARAVDNCIK